MTYQGLSFHISYKSVTLNTLKLAYNFWEQNTLVWEKAFGNFWNDPGVACKQHRNLLTKIIKVMVSNIEQKHGINQTYLFTFDWYFLGDSSHRFNTARKTIFSRSWNIMESSKRPSKYHLSTNFLAEKKTVFPISKKFKTRTFQWSVKIIFPSNFKLKEDCISISGKFKTRTLQ